MRAPVRIVLTTDPARVQALAEKVIPTGGTLHAGWDLPGRPWDLRPAGVIATGLVTPEAATRVVLAASRCAGVVGALSSGFEQPWTCELLDDLHRLGPVRLDEATAREAPLPLTDEQAELLELIAGGATAAQAAATLYLSLRSVERRLALTRRALGVRSTAEAISRWLSSASDGPR